MSNIEVDVAIIGAGSAGMAAYRAARRHTDSILLMEGDAYGTTCARVGCMPSKLLIAAANAADDARRGAMFGLRIASPVPDGERIMARVRSERDRFVGLVASTVEAWPRSHRIDSRARFVAPNTLSFGDGRLVHAARIVIATGSHPVVPAEWLGSVGNRLIVSDDIFEWERLPDSVLVIGAGAIGLEMGQALHRLGVRVRILSHGLRLGGLTDPDLTGHARKVLSEDMPLSQPAHIDRLERAGESVVVEYSQNSGLRAREQFDYVLVAAGRSPNVIDLGLESAGIDLDARGVPVSDPETTRVGNSAVFMAGDVSGRRPLLHEAADEGRIAGDNAGRYPDVRRRPRRAGLSIVFTEPQIASAGRTHAELEASGVDFAVAELDFSDQGRSRVMGRNRGLLRVYAEVETGRFLGAEMIAPDAEHLAHLLAWAVQAGLTVQQMLDSPYYHPVVEEGVRTALRLLQRKLAVPVGAIESCLDCDGLA